jgi:serine O-acetyltransferase
MTVFELIQSDFNRIQPEFTWLGFLRAYYFDQTFGLVVWYRLARHFTAKPLWHPGFMISYLMLRLFNRRTGVYLSRHIIIGPGLRIEHGGNSYIHADVKIGANCTLMHSVTVGVSHNRVGRNGVPRIGDHVFIGPNAVLYGDIHIGDGAMIGANSVVNRDVPPSVLAAGVPATIRTRTT